MNSSQPNKICTTCRKLSLSYNYSKDKLSLSCIDNLWWPTKNICKKKDPLEIDEIKGQIIKFKNIIKMVKNIRKAEYYFDDTVTIELIDCPENNCLF